MVSTQANFRRSAFKVATCFPVNPFLQDKIHCPLLELISPCKTDRYHKTSTPHDDTLQLSYKFSCHSIAGYFIPCYKRFIFNAKVARYICARFNARSYKKNTCKVCKFHQDGLYIQTVVQEIMQVLQVFFFQEYQDLTQNLAHIVHCCTKNETFLARHHKSLRIYSKKYL